MCVSRVDRGRYVDTLDGSKKTDQMQAHCWHSWRVEPWKLYIKPVIRRHVLAEYLSSPLNGRRRADTG